MTPTQIIDAAVRDICSEAVTGAPKSKVREILTKAIAEILEEVVGKNDKFLSMSYEDGYNQAKAEIRTNAAKVLGEIKQ
jgi:hypothetical protein